MPLRSLINSKRYLFPLIFVLYVILFFTLLNWMEHLKPSTPTEIKQISIIDAASTLSISGENLSTNFSALLTPNMQRQQDTTSTRFTWGNVYNVSAINSHLWIPNGRYGLLSYNIDSPHNPILSGSLSLGADFKAWNITTQKNTVLVAGGNSGLAIVDTTNPLSPKLESTLYRDKLIFDSIIKDDTAFIVTSKNGLIILDITNKKAPLEIGRISLGGRLMNIIQHGNMAYVFGKKNAKSVLHIVDISQPHQTKNIATIQLPHQIHQCQQIGDKLLLAMGKHGLYIYDINTLKPSPTPQTILDTSAFGLSVAGSDVFISNGSHHILHYTFDNETLILKKTYATEGKCHNIYCFKNILIASLGKNGFAIFDPAKPSTLSPANIYFKKTYGMSANISHANQNFIVSSMYKLNLFKKGEKKLISQYASISFEKSIDAIGWNHKYAYVSLRNNEIYRVDLRVNASRRTEKITTWPSRIQDLVVNGSNLLIGVRKKGVFSLNLDNHPLYQESETLISQPYSRFTIDDSYLYLATQPNGFKVYQLDARSKPTLVGELQYPSLAEDNSRTNGIAIKDGYAFLINGNMGLLSIDINNPQQPAIGDALSLTDGSRRIALQGDLAYIATNKAKVTVVDIHDPLKMKILCELPTTNAVAFADNNMYQLNDRGVYVNPLPQPLPIKRQSASTMKFKLPIEIAEGYYDLQLATTRQITKHSDLLHYSQQQGWSMTRKIDESRLQND